MTNTAAEKVAELLVTIGNTTGLQVQPLTSRAVEVSGFDRPDVAVYISVETHPLRLHAKAYWLGVITGEDELEVNLSANEWNANFSWPRLQIRPVAQGGYQVSCDSQLLAQAGWTIKQVSDWILHAAGGAVGVANYAASVWPKAELQEGQLREVVASLPGDPNKPVDPATLVNPKAVRSLGSAIVQLEPLAREGNPFRLISMNDGVEQVTPRRLAQTFVGGDSWEDCLISASEGVQHASFEWKGDKVDMTVHNSVLTVESGVILGDPTEDQLEAMLRRIAQLNFSDDGSTMSLVNVGSDEPQWLLRCLYHVAAKSGLTLPQLERYCLGGATIARSRLSAFCEEFSLRR